MKNLLALLIGIATLMQVSAVGAQEAWNLQKCFDYAIENNLVVKRQMLNAQYYENQVSQAKTDRLPNLNAQVSNNYGFGRTLTFPENTYVNSNSTSLAGGVGANLTLFDGFTLNNTVKQREFDLQATVQDLQKTKDDIMLSIAAEYLAILFAEEVLFVDSANIEVTRQQLERTRQLVNAGSLAKGSLLEIEAQLAREELQLVNDQNTLQLSYLNLYQYLDLPLAESFRVEKPKLPEIRANLTMINAYDIFSNAINLRPEIKAAQLRVKSAMTQLEIARGGQFPTLSLGANYNNQYTHLSFKKNSTSSNTYENKPFSDQLKNNGRSSIGLTLSIPIFNRFLVKNSISNSQIQIQDFEFQLQQARNVLRKDIELVYTNALAALNRYISTQKAVDSMKEAFRYTEEKFNVGMINSVEYNQSKNNLASAQSDLLQAKYEYIFRTKILDFYNGVPITL